MRLFSFIVLFISTSVIAQPIVIAHRGATGYLPEHTIEGYKLAISMGADYIEPDLVFTKDGILIARHDIYLSTTTDVSDHPEFAGRKRRIGTRDDWYAQDFTLAEIRTLRARQSFRGRNREHDGQYPIPTFQEVIDLAKQESTRLGKPIGLYPETKSPSHFESLGFDVAGVLLQVLSDNELNNGSAPVFIQSFEPEILRKLRQLTDVRLIQLVRPTRLSNGSFSPGRPNIPLEEITKYANGVGALKYLLINRKGEQTPFVEQAKALGLKVHVWTFRDDDYISQLFDSAGAELGFFLDMGIDGFFTDFPDTGYKVRAVYLENEH